MASRNYEADIVQFVNAFIDPDNVTPFDAFSEWTLKEIMAGVLVAFGAFCVYIGLFVLVCVTVEACYHVTARVCSWIYGCNPWTRMREVKRREKAITLKETMIARQAQNIALDVEIGVCKRLSEILRHSVTSAEERQSVLEKEKESASHEVLSDGNRAAFDKRLPLHWILSYNLIAKASVVYFSRFFLFVKCSFNTNCYSSLVFHFLFSLFVHRSYYEIGQRKSSTQLSRLLQDLWRSQQGTLLVRMKGVKAVLNVVVIRAVTDSRVNENL
ncbi:hypothetical protein EV360DRAFT_66809 [Lentinula raphanica]|nr:hypothetical protein EV360DRAFT_66809 [Lentinula raphanica]